MPVSRIGPKLGFYVLTLWAAVTLNFVIPRLMPGNIVDAILSNVESRGGMLGARAIRALDRQFGIHTHQSWIGQYTTYLGHLVTGNWGISMLYYPTPVMAVIAHALPWTAALIGMTTIIAFVVGTILGVVAAWRRNSLFDKVAAPIAMFFHSMPFFWYALVMIFVFAYTLGWFPVGGIYGITVTPGLSISFLLSVVRHAILPASTIVTASIGIWLLQMRNNMIPTIRKHYVTQARAMGLPNETIMWRYAARNALLPSLSGISMAIGFVVGGSLLTEIVFAYPGIGYTLYQAVTRHDYPLMQGCFLIIAIAVLMANFIADLLYSVLDPRTK